MGDGSRCRAALFGIPEDGLIKCSNCLGTSEKIQGKCETCQDFGFEFVGQ